MYIVLMLIYNVLVMYFQHSILYSCIELYLLTIKCIRPIAERLCLIKINENS